MDWLKTNTITYYTQISVLKRFSQQPSKQGLRNMRPLIIVLVLICLAIGLCGALTFAIYNCFICLTQQEQQHRNQPLAQSDPPSVEAAAVAETTNNNEACFVASQGVVAAATVDNETELKSTTPIVCEIPSPPAYQSLFPPT
jgi:hypothetical protein